MSNDVAFVGFYTDSELRDQLDNLARENDRSRSAELRQAVRAYLGSAVRPAGDELSKVLVQVVGKRLVGVTQEPEPKGTGWRDEQPVELIFEDGSVLVIRAYGWHDSGLGFEITSAKNAE